MEDTPLIASKFLSFGVVMLQMLSKLTTNMNTSAAFSTSPDLSKLNQTPFTQVAQKFHYTYQKVSNFLMSKASISTFSRIFLFV